MKSKNTTESDVIQMNAENTSKQNSNSELVEKIEIEDTPFTAIRIEDVWFLTMGKYRLSEPMQTKKEVLEDAQRADWWRIMAIINIMIKENEKSS